jgi:hypothetical protein
MHRGRDCYDIGVDVLRTVYGAPYQPGMVKMGKVSNLGQEAGKNLAVLIVLISLFGTELRVVRDRLRDLCVLDDVSLRAVDVDIGVGDPALPCAHTHR